MTPETTSGTGTQTGAVLPFNPLPDAGQVEGEQSLHDDAGETASEVVTEVSQTTESADEAEARRHGWVPQAEWEQQGKDATRWRPASEFMDVRRNLLSIARDENRQLRARLAAMEAREQTREQRAVEDRTKFTRESLKLELKQAQENNDWDKAAEIMDRMVDLRLAPLTPAKQQASASVPPEVQVAFSDFLTRNAWIKSDPMLARNFGIELKGALEVSTDIDTALETARERVQRLYPERFRRNGTRTSMAETGGSPSTARGGKTWNDLSDSYRKIGEQGVAKKQFTREEFLANCEGDPDAFRR